MIQEVAGAKSPDRSAELPGHLDCVFSAVCAIILQDLR